MITFIVAHFDTVITVGITVIGFAITIIVTKSAFKNEIVKIKRNMMIESMKDLPYDICMLMNKMQKINGEKPSQKIIDEFSSIMQKVLSYGSKDAVNLAVYMQQLSYNGKTEGYKYLAAYSLLTTN